MRKCDFQPSPEFVAEAKAHAELERQQAREAHAAQQDKLDPEARDRLAASYEAGTLDGEEDFAQAVVALGALAEAGVPVDAVGALRKLARGVNATGWAAAAAVAYQIGKPAAQVVERVPEIDLDYVFGGSPTIAAQCREVSNRLRVSPDLPALAALATASAALAARVDGQITYPGGATWHHPCSLMLAVEAPSGAGKSAVLRFMGDEVLEHHEAAIIREVTPRIGDAKRARELLRHERSRIMGQLTAAKAPADPDALHARLREIDVEIDRPVAAPPRFRLQDTTPAAFVRFVQASGFAFFAAGEGAVTLRQFANGADGDQIDALLSAYTGEGYLRNRVSESDQPTPNHRRLRAAALLLLQPGLLSPATEDEARLLENLARRGLFARVLIARPRRLTRDEALQKPPSSNRAPHLQRRTDAMIGWLARWKSDADPLAPEVRAVLPWAPDANDAALAHQKDMAAHAEAGGEWHGGLGREEFARRAGENVIRIAEVLRMLRAAEDVTGGEPDHDVVVEMSDFERALRVFVEYLTPNAAAAFARATFDPIGDDAERVLEVMRKHGTCMLSQVERDLGRGWNKRRSGDRVTRLEAALEVLETRGLVLSEARRGRGGGRRLRLVGTPAATR